MVTNQRNPFEGIIKLENPFTIKTLQVFTGFGVGCGIGIGIGQPVNLGAIPVVNQVMSAGSGAVHAFSGVNRHVNDALRKVGAKNIQAGLGCGWKIAVYILGIAIKPNAIHQIQFFITDAMTKLMAKVAPNLSINQDELQVPSLNNTSLMNNLINQNPLTSTMQLTNKLPEHRPGAMPGYDLTTEKLASNHSVVETPFHSRTEQVLNSFVQNPILMGDSSASGTNELGARLQSETNMLRMVLKHQQIIEELMEENNKLRQILMDDLKIPPSKLQASHLGRNKSPCTDCFECRRKQRKR
ncbi:hypothetical protein ACFE04_012450 [Oxalis oulophora]